MLDECGHVLFHPVAAHDWDRRWGLSASGMKGIFNMIYVMMSTSTVPR